MIGNPLFGLVLCQLMACVTASPFFPLLLREDRVTEATYKQIKLGMTLKKVRGILGESGNDFAEPWDISGPERKCVGTQEEGLWCHKPDDNDPGKRWWWHGWDAVLAIRLGKDGRVTDRMIITLEPLGPIDRIRQIFSQRKKLDLFGP